MANNKKCIVIVDDDVEYVESNKELLEASGYEVHTAHNGKDGLALAKKQKPDLMILDVMMASNTEGFEVARKIPQSPELKSMHILLVTGVRREMSLPFKVHPDETWLPVDKVFEKPIDPQTLLDEIKKRIG
jgi:two-component system, OmpR family, alkaline phosphatase synthesis response regulator PhoP